MFCGRHLLTEGSVYEIKFACLRFANWFYGLRSYLSPGKNWGASGTVSVYSTTVALWRVSAGQYDRIMCILFVVPVMSTENWYAMCHKAIQWSWLHVCWAVHSSSSTHRSPPLTVLSTTGCALESLGSFTTHICFSNCEVLTWHAQSPGSHPQKCMKQLWVSIPAIPVLKRTRQDDQKFK